jgi:hypothetical protein
MSRIHCAVFQGVRTEAGAHVVLGGEKLSPRFDLRNHSPTGFEWGYGGSGPAQLALAMVAAVAGDDELALTCYQDFKWGMVVSLRGQFWEMRSADVADWVKHWVKRNGYSPVETQGV